MSDALAITLGCLIAAGLVAIVFLVIRIVWLCRVWADDRRREKEYADAWLRTHRRNDR